MREEMTSRLWAVGIVVTLGALSGVGYGPAAAEAQGGGVPQFEVDPS